VSQEYQISGGEVSSTESKSGACSYSPAFIVQSSSLGGISPSASDHKEPDSPSAAQREVRLSLLNMLSHLWHISAKTQSCRTPAVSCEELKRAARIQM